MWHPPSWELTEQVAHRALEGAPPGAGAPAPSTAAPPWHGGLHGHGVTTIGRHPARRQAWSRDAPGLPHRCLVVALQDLGVSSRPDAQPPASAPAAPPSLRCLIDAAASTTPGPSDPCGVPPAPGWLAHEPPLARTRATRYPPLLRSDGAPPFSDRPPGPLPAARGPLPLRPPPQGGGRSSETAPCSRCSSSMSQGACNLPGCGRSVLDTPARPRPTVTLS